MDATYRFRVTFRLTPAGARVEPNRFETTMAIPAPLPDGPEGSSGANGSDRPRGSDAVDWLFFRDRLWRGEVGDEPTFRTFATDRLGVTVVEVAFSELRTDEAYLDALKAGIGEDVDRFNADSVDEVLHKYFGSSIHVRG